MREGCQLHLQLRARSAWFRTGWPSASRSPPRYPRLAPTMRSNAPVTSALTRITATKAPSSSGQSPSRAPTSIRMPTVIRKTPSASPLNGSMTTSTSLRYSVSAITSPATSAPRIGDRPTDAGHRGRKDHHQQRDGEEQLRLLRAGGLGEQRRQQEAADQPEWRRSPASLQQRCGRGCSMLRRRPRRSGTASEPAPDPRTAASPAPRVPPGFACPISAAPARSRTSPAPSRAKAALIGGQVGDDQRSADQRGG